MFRLSAAIAAAVLVVGSCATSSFAQPVSHGNVALPVVALAGTAGEQFADFANHDVVGEPPKGADIALNMSALRDSAEAGESVVFVAQVANLGPQTAHNVGFSLELPRALGFVGVASAETERSAAINGDDWACAETEGLVECMLSGDVPVSTLAPGLLIETVVIAGAPLGPTEAVGQASSMVGDNNPENNRATVGIEITGVKDPVFASDFECITGLPNCPGKAGVYTTREEFLANVPAGYYEEDFTDVPTGTPPFPLVFSGGGITYELDASRPWNPLTKEGGLYNNPGIVSTNSAVDSIVITVTSGELMAIGGNFWSTDIEVWPMETDVVITLSDGTVETFFSTSESDFRGFVSRVPITRIEIDAVDDPVPFWPTMDNLIVSQ